MPLSKLPIAAAIVATLAAPADSPEAARGDGDFGLPARDSEYSRRESRVVVTYAPDARSAPHCHARFAFVYAYVPSGAIRSQADDGSVEIYHVGESRFEPPGARQKISENGGSAEPARLLAVFVTDTGEHVLTAPEEN